MRGSGVHCLLLIGVGILSIASCDLAATPTTAISIAEPVSPAVRELFDQLADDDAQQREDASQRLLNYGELIRPALLDYAHHAELPEVRSRAARILCVIPWTRADDPVAVRQMLSDYRSNDTEARINAANRLAAMKDGAGFAALIRLLREDPAVEVRWAIAQQLHRLSVEAATPEGLRQSLEQLDTSGNDPPLLAAVGWAWQNVDPQKSAAVLRQAIEADAVLPAEDQGEVEMILSALYLDAVNHGQYDEAAALERRRVWRSSQPLSEAILSLFTVHAQYGPRRGFESDLKAFSAYFCNPEVMYILARMYARQNQPMMAAACARAAASTGLATQQTHKRVAQFLMARQWWDLAQIEYKLALTTSAPEKNLDAALAYLGLAHCAGGLGDDVQAAEHLETVLRILKQFPGRDIPFENQINAEIQWHHLRAARDCDDWAEVGRRLDELRQWSNQGQGRYVTNPDMGIDIITALKTVKREKEAATLFESFYEMFKQQLDAEPQNPQALNNIAWLCARCEEHVEEAVRWSAQAVKLAPGNAAYLDTAGEAAARVGKWDLAIEYESAALRLEPGEHFMREQLARFREGSSKSRKR